MNDIKTEYRKTCTHKPTPKNERSIIISVRITAAESRWVDKLRAPLHMSRSAFVRLAALNRVRPAIPAINQETLALLVNVAGSVQRLADSIGTIDPARSFVQDLANIADEFRRIRTLLMESQEQHSLSAIEQHADLRSHKERW